MKKYLLLGILAMLGTTSYSRDREVLITPNNKRVLIDRVEKIDRDIIVRDISIIKENDNVSIVVQKQSEYYDYDNNGVKDPLPQMEIKVHKSEQDDKQTSDIANLEQGIRANTNSIIENKIIQDDINKKQEIANHKYSEKLNELVLKTDTISQGIVENQISQNNIDSKQNSEIDNIKNNISDTKQAQAKINKRHESTLNVHNQRISQLENQVQNNSTQIHSLSKKVDAVGALSAAMNGIEFGNLEKGEVAIGVGYGLFKDTNAVAVGVSTALDDNISANAKVSVTNGHDTEYSASCGVTYKFSWQ